MTIKKDINVEDWIEIKYNGRVCLVAMDSLLKAWMRERTLNSLRQAKQ